MIKLFSFKKIAIASLLLLLALILYNYPEKLEENIFQKENEKPFYLFLIDKNNYVAMIDTYLSRNSSDLVRNIFEVLKEKNEYLPEGFYGVIPYDTLLLDYSIDNGLLKLNFSSDILNISLENENKMLESLIYSYTALDYVDGIMIFVEDEILTELPNSKKKLDLYLDRDYGINKKVDITTFSNIKMVTVYYNSDDYYIPISYVVNSDKEKIEIIIDSLKTNKFIDDNLASHLDYQVELMNYENVENDFFLNFNEVLLDSVYDGKLKEEVKYALSYSIFDSYNVENVVFSVNSNKIDDFGLAKQ